MRESIIRSKWALICFIAGIAMVAGIAIAPQNPAQQRDRRVQRLTEILRNVHTKDPDSSRLLRRVPPITQFGSNGIRISWRQVLACSNLSDEAPTADRDWRDPSYVAIDDSFASLLTLGEVTTLPRDQRFTHIMAIDHPRAAFPMVRNRGWDYVELLAPHLILLLEVDNARIPWMADGDIDINNARITSGEDSEFGIGSSYGSEFFVVFVDGAIWTLDERIPMETLKKFLIIDEAAIHDRDRELLPYKKRIICTGKPCQG